MTAKPHHPNRANSSNHVHAQSDDMIDISPVVNSSFPVFPGDTAFDCLKIVEMKSTDLAICEDRNSNGQVKQSSFSLSRFTMSPHCGAHADSPSHFNVNGDSIEKLKLNPFIGPCVVIEVDIRRNSRIGIEDLPLSYLSNQSVNSSQLPPRVLFKTSSFDYGLKWQDDFVALDPELIYFLKKHGIELIGIDTPSVDLANDKELLSHQALAKTGIRNLENLDLRNATTGTYTLVALPLNLSGLEASPVRAILLKRGAAKWLFPQE